MLDPEAQDRVGSAGRAVRRPRSTGMMSKRAFDLTVTLLGTLVLLPVLTIVAVFVRLNSPGPVLFRQLRVGRGGKDFVLLKFRTMTVRSGSEKGAFDAGDGSRVTKVGRFLRAAKADELPQLWNVIRGDMRSSGPVPRSVNGLRSILSAGRSSIRYTGNHGSGRNPLSE